MANIESAKKRIRQTERRTDRNRERMSRTRTFIRKVMDAITSGDQAKAQEALRLAQPEIVKAAQKGPLHRKTASRKVSRLATRIKAMVS